MEDQKNMSMKSGMCECGCGCGWPHGHRMFRVILGLIILAIVFAIGVKVGEVKSRFEGGFGRRMYYHSYPTMMQPGQGAAAQPGTATQ